MKHIIFTTFVISAIFLTTGCSKKNTDDVNTDTAQKTTEETTESQIDNQDAIAETPSNTQNINAQQTGNEPTTAQNTDKTNEVAQNEDKQSEDVAAGNTDVKGIPSLQKDRDDYDDYDGDDDMDGDGDGDDWYHDDDLILKELGVKRSELKKPDALGEYLLSSSLESHEVRALITARANVNYRDDEGNTPLFYASNDEIVDMLIDAGAKVDAENDEGETPLFYAENEYVLKSLIKAGADVHHIDDDGNTALDRIKEDLKLLKKSETGDQKIALLESAMKNTPKKAVNEIEIPKATGEVVCTNWNNNLFTNGSELYYKIKVETICPSETEENDQEEKNQNDQFELYVLCNVKLNYVSDVYCGSSVTCELDPKYKTENNQEIFNKYMHIAGNWFIDNNGIYYFDEFPKLVKASEKGQCSRTKYIKCEPNTLAYEYKKFERKEPMFPLRPDVKVYETSDDNTSKTTVSRTGTVLCHHEALNKDNREYVNDLCIDDVKGPTSFKAIDYKSIDNKDCKVSLKGSLRQKK